MDWIFQLTGPDFRFRFFIATPLLRTYSGDPPDGPKNPHSLVPIPVLWIFYRQVRYNGNMQEQPVSDNGTSVGNPTEVRTANTQQNQGNTPETERKTGQNSDELQDVRSDTRRSISEGGSVFNAKQASAYLKKDEKTIRNWISSGRIHAEKVKGSWQITKADLDAAFVTEQQKHERKTEREKSDVRSSKNLDKQDQTQENGQETKQEIPTPTDSRSDATPDPAGEVGERALVQQLKSQIKEHEKLINEKDLRLTESKAAFERQFTEKDQRLNDKDDRINDLKSDREKDKKLYNDLLTNAQLLIQSLQTQVAQLEAPKQPVKASVEAVEGDYQESDDTGAQAKPEAEQRTGEQEQERPRRRWWQR